MHSTINNTINLFFGNSVYKSKLSDHNQTQNHGLKKTPNRATLNCDYTPLSIENKIPRPDGTRKIFSKLRKFKDTYRGTAKRFDGERYVSRY